jgi:hypothetical protein
LIGYRHLRVSKTVARLLELPSSTKSLVKPDGIVGKQR